MNEEQKQKAKELIKQGKWDYVLKYGILRVGGIMFLIFLFLDKFIYEKKITESDVLFGIIIWGIAGLVYGVGGVLIKENEKTKH